MKLKDIGSLLKDTFKEWREDKAPRLAAALSYYTLFSLAPLLVIVIGIAGLAFGRQAAEEQLVGQIQELVGSQQAAEAIQGMIAGASNRSAGLIATVVGIVASLIGAAGVFGQLQESLNTIWEVAPRTGGGLLEMVKDRFLSFTMVLGIGFLLLVSLVITALLSMLDQFFAGLFPGVEFLYQTVNFVISFGVITLLFALIFKILPDVQIAWRDVWLGAAVTALLFTLGRLAIGIYLGTQAVNDTYGAAGSLIIILLWVYYSAQILFFGAEFTQVYANRFGSRIVPEGGAVPLSEAARVDQGIPHRETVAAAQIAHTGAQQPAAPRSETLPSALKTQSPGISSLPALSALLAVLVGFLGGVAVMKGSQK